MIVSSENLSKSYGTFRALTDCNICVESGEVFGFLGPNGAGKTTFLRTLLGFIKPTSGQACIAGFDCSSQSVRVREKTAYLPGEARLFRRMRGHHVLDFSLAYEQIAIEKSAPRLPKDSNSTAKDRFHE